MKKIITVTGILLFANLLTACSENTQTVEWYKKHPEVLEEEVEKCKLKTLAELSTDKHCTVIRLAQREAFHEHERNAPLPNIQFK